MAKRPPGPVWEGDFDGPLGPCWRQPLAALALVVSDIKDKAKGLDPVSPRPGVAQTDERPNLREAQASALRAAGEGEDFLQVRGRSLKLAVRPTPLPLLDLPAKSEPRVYGRGHVLARSRAWQCAAPG